MKESVKKTITLIASFMIFGLGVAENSLSMENSFEAFGKDVGLTSEMYFNTKFSDNVTAKATIVNLLDSYNAESSVDFNDWSADNYTFKSPVSLNDFYVEYGKENFSGGAGFKTFPEREGLLSALQDIEYQFFPVDATNPLRMKRMGVPGLWGKFFFS